MYIIICFLIIVIVRSVRYDPIWKLKCSYYSYCLCDIVVRSIAELDASRVQSFHSRKKVNALRSMQLISLLSNGSCSTFNKLLVFEIISRYTLNELGWPEWAHCAQSHPAVQRPFSISEMVAAQCDHFSYGTICFSNNIFLFTQKQVIRNDKQIHAQRCEEISYLTIFFSSKLACSYSV